MKGIMIVALSLVVVIAVAICGSGATDVSLTSNLGERAAIYGQNVSFTCKIVSYHDIIITWISAAYIGNGGVVLQLTSGDPPGRIRFNPRNPTTVAILVNATHINNKITAISELRLIASVRSSIHCTNTGDGTMDTKTLFVDPRVILKHDLDDGGVAYDGQRAIFTCTIDVGPDNNNIIVVTWSSDDYIGTGGVNLQLMSADPPGSNTSYATTVATLINTTRSSDGMVTVTSELQLVASTQYPSSNISCKASYNGHERVATVAFQTSMQLTESSPTTGMAQSLSAIQKDLIFYLIGCFVGVAYFIQQDL